MRFEVLRVEDYLFLGTGGIEAADIVADTAADKPR
jgi:hypothetical protein